MEPGREPWDHDLPRIVSTSPITRGTLKGEARHFIVREQEAYAPEDNGDYFFIRLTREGWSTRALRARLSEALGVPENKIGYAGLKDKRALVSQTFSMPRAGLKEEAVAARIEETPGLKVDWLRPHPRPLKVGHLAGNRFRILMTDMEPGPHGVLEEARRLGAQAMGTGVPNYFGGQRFGREGDNAIRGRRILRGERCRDPWLRDLLLSAYQSRLFNAWLGERIRRGDFHRLVRGDAVLKKNERGFLDIDNPEAHGEQFAAGEIDYTGPLFGARTPRAGYEAGKLDRLVLEQDGMEPRRFARSGLTGARRRGRLFARELEIEARPEGLEFSFFLPKGAYATVFLREFVAPGGLREPAIDDQTDGDQADDDQTDQEPN